MKALKNELQSVKKPRIATISDLQKKEKKFESKTQTIKRRLESGDQTVLLIEEERQKSDVDASDEEPEVDDENENPQARF